VHSVAAKSDNAMQQVDFEFTGSDPYRPAFLPRSSTERILDAGSPRS
jgi:hypothetical protein